MRVIGTYRFTVFGDGRDDEHDIQLRALKAPDPLLQGAYPTGIAEARVGASPGGVTATLMPDHIVHLKFDIPPSTAQVTIDALFGTTYGETELPPPATKETP
jgi:hypothetical protein